MFFVSFQTSIQMLTLSHIMTKSTHSQGGRGGVIYILLIMSILVSFFIIAVNSNHLSLQQWYQVVKPLSLWWDNHETPKEVIEVGWSMCTFYHARWCVCLPRRVRVLNGVVEVLCELLSKDMGLRWSGRWWVCSRVCVCQINCTMLNHMFILIAVLNYCSCRSHCITTSYVLFKVSQIIQHDIFQILSNAFPLLCNEFQMHTLYPALYSFLD